MSNTSPDVPSIAVIGAGVAGLGAARALKIAGCPVIVFEQSSVPGGRLASHCESGFVFDSGAQNIKSEGTAFDSAVREVLAAAEIFEITAPVCLHHDGKILPPDEKANAARKWSCRGGLSRLGERLAAGLDIRYEIAIGSVEAGGDTLILLDCEGKTLGEFDTIVCALPLPQAARLLETADVSAERLALLFGVQYSRCLSVLLHFEATLAADWYALLAQDRSHPLLWLASENAKGQSGYEAGTALVAQLGPQASEELWQAADGEIVQQVSVWIGQLLGSDFRESSSCTIKRWPYAQPRNPIEFEAANPVGSRIVVCGDGLSAARVPDAYASGLRAAEFLLTTLSGQA